MLFRPGSREEELVDLGQLHASLAAKSLRKKEPSAERDTVSFTFGY